MSPKKMTAHYSHSSYAVFLRAPYILAHALGYRDLRPIHSQWIRFIWDPSITEESRLLLAHRNSYKSTAVVVVGTIWYLLTHPEDTVMIVRKEAKAAISALERIKRHYQSPFMQELYTKLGMGGIKVLHRAKQEQLSLALKTGISQEGNIEIASVSAISVTGRHYERIHLDDVVTESDRDSAVERARTERFYANLNSVIKPGGIITATGTPWHKDDLYGKFDVTMRCPLSTVVIPSFSAKSVQARQALLPPSEFSSQYLLCEKAKEEQLFAHFKLFNSWNEDIKSFAHLDAAFGGANTSALTIVQYVRPDKNQHLADSITQAPDIYVVGFVFVGHIRHHYARIHSLIKAYHVKELYMETNADKGATLYDLAKQNPNELIVKGYHEHRSKHNKIVKILYPLWPTTEFYTESDSKYLEQIREYHEHSTPNDAPDSLASLLSFLFKHPTLPTPDLTNIYLSSLTSEDVPVYSMEPA